MVKNALKTFAISFMIMMISPMLNAKAATSQTVNDQDSLKAALANEEVTTITLSSDINTTEKINITRPVTIDGKGHTIKYVGTFGSNQSSDNTIWSGIYILQVYKTSATIRDIKLTGGNAALLVNGSNVKLEGTIDVSGNGFGGIELSQGAGVEATSKLNVDNNANIVNTSDSENRPTLWVPEDSDPAIVTMNGETQTISSGDELTLTEVEALFNISNPQTGDSIFFSFVLGLIGMIIFIGNFKAIKQN